jgi:hypothetical protein
MPLEQSTQLFLFIKLSNFSPNERARVSKGKGTERGTNDNAPFATQGCNCGQNRLISTGK